MPGRNPKTPWRATERTGPKCVAFSFVSSAEFLCHEWWMTWINIHCNILCGSVSAIIPDMDQYILLYQDIQADNYWFGWRVDVSIDWWIECSVAGLMCWRTDLMWGLIERTQTVPCIFAIQRAGDERERERIICCLSYVLVFFLVCSIFSYSLNCCLSFSTISVFLSWFLSLRIFSIMIRQWPEPNVTPSQTCLNNFPSALTTRSPNAQNTAVRACPSHFAAPVPSPFPQPLHSNCAHTNTVSHLLFSFVFPVLYCCLYCSLLFSTHPALYFALLFALLEARSVQCDGISCDCWRGPSLPPRM